MTSDLAPARSRPLLRKGEKGSQPEGGRVGTEDPEDCAP
jgi:hypothetical protein